MLQNMKIVILMYTYRYIQIHTHIHTEVRTYIYIHVCVCDILVYTHTCLYVSYFSIYLSIYYPSSDNYLSVYTYYIHDSFSDLVPCIEWVPVSYDLSFVYSSGKIDRFRKDGECKYRDWRYALKSKSIY